MNKFQLVLLSVQTKWKKQQYQLLFGFGPLFHSGEARDGYCFCTGHQLDSEGLFVDFVHFMWCTLHAAPDENTGVNALGEELTSENTFWGIMFCAFCFD